MNARDNLTEILGRHREIAWNHDTGNAICCDCDEILGPFTADMYEQDRWFRIHLANALIAAGYTKEPTP